MHTARRSLWSGFVVLPTVGLLAAAYLTAPAEAAAPCVVPAGVRAEQVVLVRGPSAAQVRSEPARRTRAVVTGCRRTEGGRYVRELGPWTARVGGKGIAPRGVKREGDLRTPSGVFALRTAFGAGRDPGLRVEWLDTDARDVWVDDRRSAAYNTHRRTPARGRWRSAERMDQSAYRYAQVIGYNEARVPGRGSAIFLHLDTGRATAGCVALSSPALLKLLRWQDPGAVVAIS